MAATDLSAGFAAVEAFPIRVQGNRVNGGKAEETRLPVIGGGKCPSGQAPEGMPSGQVSHRDKSPTGSSAYGGATIANRFSRVWVARFTGGRVRNCDRPRWPTVTVATRNEKDSVLHLSGPFVDWRSRPLLSGNRKTTLIRERNLQVCRKLCRKALIQRPKFIPHFWHRRRSSARWQALMWQALMWQALVWQALVGQARQSPRRAQPRWWARLKVVRQSEAAIAGALCLNRRIRPIADIPGPRWRRTGSVGAAAACTSRMIRDAIKREICPEIGGVA
jgi:hypothetical protein